MGAGRFRQDLYYRINGLSLQLPALHERNDLAALVRLMLDGLAPGRDLVVAPEVMVAFRQYRWPRNLRQLHNVLQTAVALLDDGDIAIGFDHLPDEIPRSPATRGADAGVEDAATDLRLNAQRCLRHALEASGGNLSDAARRLGVSRSKMYRKLQAAGLA